MTARAAAAAPLQETLALSDFQRRTLALPEEFDLFLGGGRGGAKSFTLALLAIRHAEQYRERARILYIRQTYKGLADFESICRDLFGQAYGTSATYNAHEHCWRLPTGAYFELAQLADVGDYAKFQGRSFSVLLVDEAGQYATPELLDRLRSNLRAPRGTPIRVVMAANPGDPGHYWLASRYVFRDAPPWTPFLEEKSGRQWVYAPSTFLDNPFIDTEEYRAQLGASCPADPELLRAWLEGDWSVARGAFFGGVLSEQRSAFGPWTPEEFGARDALKPGPFGLTRSYVPGPRPAWQLWLAHDFGTSAPSVTYVVAKSPGAEGPDGRYYPRDSILLVDELATAQPGHVDKGMGYTIPHLAELVVELAKRWGIPAAGVADDACFSKHGHSAGSIADEFRGFGVQFRPARKGDRRARWERMRRLLEAAGKPDVPGLYVSRACAYFWATVPYLGRDPRRPDDVDSSGPDHGADAASYGLAGDGLEPIYVGPLAGWY